MESLDLDIPERPKTDKKQAYSILSCFFILLQIIFTLDFGFTRRLSFKLQVITTCLFLVMSLTLVGYNLKTTFENYYHLYNAFYMACLCEYVVCVLYLKFCSFRYSIAHLQKDLVEVDSLFGAHTNTIPVEYIVLFFWVFFTTYRLAFTTVYCELLSHYCLKSYVRSMLYFTPMYCVEVVILMYGCIFYMVNHRLKKLRIFITNINPEHLIYCQHIYKKLVDCTDKVREDYDFTFVVGLTYIFPRVLLGIYRSIHDTKYRNQNASMHLILSFYVVSGLLLVCVPALTATLLASEGDKILTILYDRVLQECGQPHVPTIERVIDYIESRNFHIKIYQVMSLDGSFPLVMLNVCLTYTVTMIQMDHLD